MLAKMPVAVIDELSGLVNYEQANRWICFIRDNQEEIKNPGGFIRTAITEDWQVPKNYEEHLQKQKMREEQERKEQEAKLEKKREEDRFNQWVGEQPESVIIEAEELARIELEKQTFQPKSEEVRDQWLEGFKKDILRGWFEKHGAG